jgi:hypothetical protein
MIMLARMLSMDSVDIPQLNSSKIEKKSEQFIKILNDEAKCDGLFEKIVHVLESSGLDLSKSQFKAESETEILINKLINNLSPRRTNRLS